MQEVIDYARMQFGEPGRRNFSWFDKLTYLKINKPSWCDRSDALYDVFANKWQVLAHGVVVWAHIIQANMLLFKPGIENCPASIVFSPDRHSIVDPGILGQIAHPLYELKGTSPNNPQLKAFADALTDEMTRTFGVQVPKFISPQFDTYEATTFVTRKHLPNGILSLPFFPIVVMPTAPHYNFPLPSRYWPQPFVDYWMRSAQ